jgi:hypothetical protein
MSFSGFVRLHRWRNGSDQRDEFCPTITIIKLLEKAKKNIHRLFQRATRQACFASFVDNDSAFHLTTIQQHLPLSDHDRQSQAWTKISHANPRLW